jgi:putative endonuclease
MSKGGYVYILSNRPSGTLYIGVTNDLIRRVFEHREGVIEGFTKTYELKQLIYYERYDDIRLAIQRERTMKHWPRAWKVRLTNGFNREWVDSYPSLTS